MGLEASRAVSSHVARMDEANRPARDLCDPIMYLIFSAPALMDFIGSGRD